ncbi:hypothetical protein pb186bvf_014396 [Paramecium bursaria]
MILYLLLQVQQLILLNKIPLPFKYVFNELQLSKQLKNRGADYPTKNAPRDAFNIINDNQIVDLCSIGYKLIKKLIKRKLKNSIEQKLIIFICIKNKKQENSKEKNSSY